MAHRIVCRDCGAWDGEHKVSCKYSALAQPQSLDFEEMMPGSLRIDGDEAFRVDVYVRTSEQSTEGSRTSYELTFCNGSMVFTIPTISPDELKKLGKWLTAVATERSN